MPFVSKQYSYTLSAPVPARLSMIANHPAGSVRIMFTQCVCVCVFVSVQTYTERTEQNMSRPVDHKNSTRARDAANECMCATSIHTKSGL